MGKCGASTTADRGKPEISIQQLTALPGVLYHHPFIPIMSRPTLAQQLKQLEAEETPQSVDPESAYSNLDGLNITERKGNEGREHYLDVGPSRLRGQFGDMGDRYGGEVRGRQKIFDDDDDDEEEADEDEDEEGGGESMEGEDDEEEDGDEDEDEAEGDDDAEDEDDEDEEAEEEEEEDLPPPPPKSTSSSRLDPVAALRDSRMKDIEKGQAIKRQKVTLLSTRLISIDTTGDLRRDCHSTNHLSESLDCFYFTFLRFT